MATGTVTYTGDLSKPLDRVRFEIGDVDCANAYLSDEEINGYLTIEENSILRAAAKCAAAIAARVAREIDYSHGPIRKSASQRFEHFNALARELESRASTENVVPYLGPTPADQEAADADVSRVQPTFREGMTDNPRAGPQESPEPDEVSSI